MFAPDTRERAIDSPAGWLIALIGLLTLVLTWGSIFTFTVYADRLVSAFGLTPLRVSSVFSLMTAAFFIAGGTIGILVARMRFRRVILATAAAVALSVALLQVVGSYLGVVAAFTILGAAGGTLFVVIVSLVPQWFDRYQGRAMGITLTGNGLGVLVFPFVWLWLFERTDIRGAFLAVGAGLFGVVVLASLVYRRPPGTEPSASATLDVGWLRRTLAGRRFQVALVGYALLWGWYFILSSGLVDILTAAGITRRLAATAFGTVGGISVLARVGAGTVGDVVGIRRTFLGGVALAAIGVLLLAITRSPALMYATLVIFGVGLGALGALFSPVIIERFGPENATALVGLFTIAEAATAFSIPIAMNAAVGVLGGYPIPLVGLGGLTALGVLLFGWGTAGGGSATG